METPQNALTELRVLSASVDIASCILSATFLLSILNFDLEIGTNVIKGLVILFFVQGTLLALNYRQVWMTCRICESFLKKEVFEKNINVSSIAEYNEEAIHSTRLSPKPSATKEKPATEAVDDASATKEKPATEAVEDASATKEKPATEAVEDASATKEKPATEAVEDASATKEKPATEVVDDASTTKEKSVIVTDQSSSDKESILEDDTRMCEVSNTAYLLKCSEILKIASSFYPGKYPDLSIAEKLKQNSIIDSSSQMFQNQGFNELARLMRECENYSTNSQNISPDVTRECPNTCSSDVGENEPLVTEILSRKHEFHPAVKPKAEIKDTKKTFQELYERKTKRQIDEPKSEVKQLMPRIPMKRQMPKIPKKEFAIKHTKERFELIMQKELLIIPKYEPAVSKYAPTISVNELLNSMNLPLSPEYKSLIIPETTHGCMSTTPYRVNWIFTKKNYDATMLPSSEDMLGICCQT